MGSFEIHGLDGLMGTLSGIDITGTAEKNVEQAAQHLQGEIRSRAPVRTGHLRSSYDYVVRSQGDSTVAFVGTNVNYSQYQEFGTSIMGAQPHVRPALDSNRQQLVEIMAGQTLRDAFNF